MRMQGTFFLCIVICLFVKISILNAKTWAYFSSKDNISEKLIELINNSKQRIHAAIYFLTNSSIANALIEAKNKKQLDIQIVTDMSCLENEYNKIEILKNNGIDVFIFKPKKLSNKKSNEIMHNKFVLLDNKVWTGSYNWTRSANQKNLENVLCTDEESVCKKYEEEFEKLKLKCNKRNTLNKESNNKNQSLKNKIFELLKNIKSRLG